MKRIIEKLWIIYLLNLSKPQAENQWKPVSFSKIFKNYENFLFWEVTYKKELLQSIVYYRSSENQKEFMNAGGIILRVWAKNQLGFEIS